MEQGTLEFLLNTYTAEKDRSCLEIIKKNYTATY